MSKQEMLVISTKERGRLKVWRSFRRSGATILHVNNVPLKVRQDIIGHANPDMSLLYAEAELAYRRSTINLLEEIVFGVHNQTLTDANGGEKERFQSLQLTDFKDGPVAHLDRAADRFSLIKSSRPGIAASEVQRENCSGK